MKKSLSVLIIVCILISLFGTSINAEDNFPEEHLHSECCESCSITPLALGDGDAVVPTATCYFGHWFTTTEYRTGGICYANVNPTLTCQIIVYKVVTCNYCGMQLSHTEYSRRDGCIFLENH